jgi:hypothetical protein
MPITSAKHVYIAKKEAALFEVFSIQALLACFATLYCHFSIASMLHLF